MTPKTEASQGRSTASEEINPTSSTTMAMVPPSFHDNNALKIPKTVEESCMQSRKSQQESTSRTSSSSISKCFQKPLVPENRSVTHEFHASWISKVTFSWISPLMNVGYRRTLELNDIWKVSPDRSFDELLPKFETSFSDRRSRKDKNPLCGAIIEACWFDFWTSGLALLASMILMVIAPFLLRYLIEYVAAAYIAKREGIKEPNVGKGVGYVIGIVAMQEMQSLLTNYSTYRSMLVGGQVRAILIASVFKKSLKISARAKAGVATSTTTTASDDGRGSELEPDKEKFKVDDTTTPEAQSWSNGQVLSLASIDAHRVDDALANFHTLWTGLIALLMSVALLIINLGYSPLPGFGLIIVVFPMIGKGIGKLFVIRQGINRLTDQRSSMAYEIFQGIRFVKVFGWERAFFDRLTAIRKAEVTKIGSFLALRNFMAAVSIATPTFASILTFVTYALTKHELSSSKIFSSVSIFNVLKFPLTTMPVALGLLSDGWAALERLQSYLSCEENKDVLDHGSSSLIFEKPELDGKAALQLKEASFTWEESTEEKVVSGKKGLVPNEKAKIVTNIVDKNRIPHLPFKITPSTVKLYRGELVAVIGGVGSGKTSFLEALTGEMRKTSGTIAWSTSRSYCPQEPWIQNATIRNNILFGKQMNAEWYNKVVHACALTRDFEILLEGDLTEIGERGINLSGGQKQRVNLARAIYADSEALLLDSPLSAVDAHVGKHILENAIVSLLKNKLRILVTHQLEILHRCDRIIWVDDGSLRAIDTFSNLMTHDEAFAKMVTAGLGTKTEVIEKRDTNLKRSPTNAERAMKNEHQTTESLIKAEHQAEKNVPWKVYYDYLKSSGSIFWPIITLVVMTVSQGLNIGSNLWLSWWISDKFHYVLGLNIGIYVALGVANVVVNYAFFLAVSLIAIMASKSMYNRALHRVLNSPISYFDTTPLGRIIGVFSKDVDNMDYNLTDAIRLFILLFYLFIATCALTIAYFYWFALALVPLLMIFLGMSLYYRHSAREIKRHEATLQSIVYSRMSEGLSGVSCIRAYEAEAQFTEHFKQAIDNMNSAYYLTFANQRWFSVRLDVIANILLLVTGILAVTSRFSRNPSTTGLVLSYMLGISQLMQLIVRQFASVENAMNATERIHYYGTALEQEEDETVSCQQLPNSWPQSGRIEFKGVGLRYRPELPLVLEGFDLDIRGGERVGIVGRTGAGKSSLVNALFRLTELANGQITVDGQDISQLALEQLRSRLAIIPQDPTLFRGTIRANLDPFSQYTDLQLWTVLRKANLYSGTRATIENSSNPIAAAPSTSTSDTAFSQNATSAGTPVERSSPLQIRLDDHVEEQGHNYSLGQRQLLAFARALVRDSQIIVCDEVTSSVDLETDLAIQATMKDTFHGKTVLCIAHRLRTVLGYDRICVMDQGKIIELDTPRALFQKTNGVFRNMCLENSITIDLFN